MSRFFVPSNNIQYEGDTPVSIDIVGTDVNHIKNVLRKSEGENILLCDSKGVEYMCVISEITQERIAAKVIAVNDVSSEPSVPVFLLQGVPKGDKMELIVQKCVELGISGIVPVVTEHTVVKFGSTADREKKQVRWQRISLEAAKQCGRGVVPPVFVPADFDAALTLAEQGMLKDCLKIVPYENEQDVSLRDVLTEKKAELSCYKGICIFIGPEGGFSKKEIVRAVDAGFITVSLGKRILRTETAGLATVAAIRYEFGD